MRAVAEGWPLSIRVAREPYVSPDRGIPSCEGMVTTLGLEVNSRLRLFGGRLLDFDRRAARCYAEITRSTTAAGVPIPLADGLIAAIALAHGFAVATRDAAPFRAAGIEVIDPWGDE